MIAFAPPAPVDQACGTKVLYGKTLSLHAMGDGLTCDDVAKITAGDECKIDLEKETWGCFSARANDPALLWFKTKEMFAEDWSAWIEARRPPCAPVTASAWKHAQTGGFPTERQILSDDLIRCKQLKGKTRAQVLKLLGKPDDKAKRYVDWLVGDTRDSFIQVDGEFLAIRFDKHNRVRTVTLDQG